MVQPHSRTSWLDSKTRYVDSWSQAQLVNNGDQRVSVLGPDKDTRSYDAIFTPACGACHLHTLEPLAMRLPLAHKGRTLFTSISLTGREFLASCH